MRLRKITACLLTALAVWPVAIPPAAARVDKVYLSRSYPLPAEVPTGASGPYEALEGTVEFAFDPDSPANARIVDLARAPRDARGRVLAKANFVILRPTDPEKSSGIGFLEVSNRGGKASLRYFNGGARDSTLRDPSAYGDGLLMREGLTLVWIGWQYDIPRDDDNMWLEAPVARNADGSAIHGLVRSDWVIAEDGTDTLSVGHRILPAFYPATDLAHPDHVLTRRTTREGARETIPREAWSFARREGEELIADPTHIHMPEGFQPGYIYELVYRAKDPVVAGVGLAAVRDFMSHLKYDEGAVASVGRGIAFGVSQTGRFLRHFLYQGFNVDEKGRPVFDGMLIHTAGAGRGSFNHRFAQPSRDGHPFSAFFYPTDLFPFSTYPQPAPGTGEVEGLLDALPAAAIPKMMVTNAGYEYWGRAASLIHTDWRTGADVPQHENERIYHLASGQHFVEPLPFEEGADIAPGIWLGNPLDFLVTLRALAKSLIAWVDTGHPPPASRIPKTADGMLIPIEDIVLPEGLGLAQPDRLHVAYQLDYGPRWRAGIIDRQPPELVAPIVPKVPALDEHGNEISSVRAVELRAPLATFLPWARLPAGPFPNELVNFRGLFIPFWSNDSLRATWNDPRPSAEALYANELGYRIATRKAAQELIEDGFLLPEDLPRIEARAALYWGLVN